MDRTGSDWFVRLTAIDEIGRDTVKSFTLDQILKGVEIGRKPSESSKSRDPSCEPSRDRLDDGLYTSPVISRNHCKITCSAITGKLTLTDGGSRHGTFLKGHAVTNTSLYSNDVVSFGKSIMKGDDEHAPVRVRVAVNDLVRFPVVVDRVAARKQSKYGLSNAFLDSEDEDDVKKTKLDEDGFEIAGSIKADVVDLVACDDEAASYQKISNKLDSSKKSWAGATASPAARDSIVAESIDSYGQTPRATSQQQGKDKSSRKSTPKAGVHARSRQASTEDAADKIESFSAPEAPCAQEYSASTPGDAPLMSPQWCAPTPYLVDHEPLPAAGTPGGERSSSPPLEPDERAWTPYHGVATTDHGGERGFSDEEDAEEHGNSDHAHFDDADAEEHGESEDAHSDDEYLQSNVSSHEAEQPPAKLQTKYSNRAGLSVDEDAGQDILPYPSGYPIDPPGWMPGPDSDCSCESCVRERGDQSEDYELLSDEDENEDSEEEDADEAEEDQDLEEKDEEDLDAPGASKLDSESIERLKSADQPLPEVKKLWVDPLARSDSMILSYDDDNSSSSEDVDMEPLIKPSDDAGTTKQGVTANSDDMPELSSGASQSSSIERSPTPNQQPDVREMDVHEWVNSDLPGALLSPDRILVTGKSKELSAEGPKAPVTSSKHAEVQAGLKEAVAYYAQRCEAACVTLDKAIDDAVAVGNPGFDSLAEVTSVIEAMEKALGDDETPLNVLLDGGGSFRAPGTDSVYELNDCIKLFEMALRTRRRRVLQDHESITSELSDLYRRRRYLQSKAKTATLAESAPIETEDEILVPETVSQPLSTTTDLAVPAPKGEPEVGMTVETTTTPAAPEPELPLIQSLASAAGLVPSASLTPRPLKRTISNVVDTVHEPEDVPRPIKRKAIRTALGAFILGSVIGSASTIAGLLQYAD